jgi:hypothetical protein
MTDYEDQSHDLIAHVRASIDAFDGSRLSIGRLSTDLRSQLAALESVADSRWVEELRAMRNQIEVVNAFLIESGRSSLNEDERREVEDILGVLRAALVAY